MKEHANLSRAATARQTGFGGLIGESPPMQRLYELIGKVSQSTSPVLLLGESGTGKELVARAIHSMGPRREAPFAPVDCSALVATLVESELFGHIKGAFTGAGHTKQGLFEVASNGTLFLDEIGDFPLELQAKLLRALQEKEIRPVGSTERIPMDVRVIAATNRDLEAAIRSGRFRQDLYFRVNVVQIKLPPLRERKTDIPLLVDYFLEKFSGPSQPARTISAEAMRRLMAYDWPGNVRELENAIERAIAMADGPNLGVDDLPLVLQHAWAQCDPESTDLVSLEELERRTILQALQKTGGDRLAAARLLGIGKTTLYRKLKQYSGDSS
jgi:DNA-binding NtrC family response regulator